MSVRKIEASFEHICDGCGAVERTASTSRPKYWADLHILQDAYDYQGCAVADGSVKRLLCSACRSVVVDAANAAIEQRRAQTPPAAGGKNAE